MEQKILDKPGYQESNPIPSNPATEPNLTTGDQNPPSQEKEKPSASQEMEEILQDPEEQDGIIEDLEPPRDNQEEHTSFADKNSEESKSSEESIPDPP